MDKTHLYDLGYAFRKAKPWKEIFEEELFAVKLGKKAIGYCSLMGRNGEHMALAVYPGAEGFTSYRKLASRAPDHVPTSKAELLVQDCIQCSIERRDMLDPEELDELKDYCQKTGIPFRGPFPQFTRYYPYCMPCNVNKPSDWRAIETALQVLLELTKKGKTIGKAGLGLRPVAVSLNGEEYISEEHGGFGGLLDDVVTIPLYSIVNGKLAAERIPLPPYTERKLAPPFFMDETAIARLMQKRHKGTLECEIIRMPEPVDGDPPYLPAVLMTIDQDGLLLPPIAGEGPEYSPTRMLDEFISALGDACPKVIKVRTAETKLLLAEFCRKTKIRLVETEDMALLDDAIEDLMERFSEDAEESDSEERLNEMIYMLSAMTVEELRTLPREILDHILEGAEFFPKEIVQKVQRARGK